MVEVIIEKRRCKRCNSSQTRIRFKTKERICGTCGYIEKLNDEEINNG